MRLPGAAALARASRYAAFAWTRGAWLRFNLAFGGLFPSLGSELYFALEHRG